MRVLRLESRLVVIPKDMKNRLNESLWSHSSCVILKPLKRRHYVDGWCIVSRFVNLCTRSLLYAMFDSLPRCVFMEKTLLLLSVQNASVSNSSWSFYHPSSWSINSKWNPLSKGSWVSVFAWWYAMQVYIFLQNIDKKVETWDDWHIGFLYAIFINICTVVKWSIYQNTRTASKKILHSGKKTDWNTNLYDMMMIHTLFWHYFPLSLVSMVWIQRCCAKVFYFVGLLKEKQKVKDFKVLSCHCLILLADGFKC